jgi:hypothetical protein
MAEEAAVNDVERLCAKACEASDLAIELCPSRFRHFVKPEDGWVAKAWARVLTDTQIAGTSAHVLGCLIRQQEGCEECRHGRLCPMPGTQGDGPGVQASLREWRAAVTANETAATTPKEQ